VEVGGEGDWWAADAQSPSVELAQNAGKEKLTSNNFIVIKFASTK